ncbi:MAG TPA: hypothetical protein VJK51_00180 [Candidatus Nanoarchaeia archaeon]|nr:hypothetical protein [Candidatus Nanoarchaeia archaeon]
MNEENELLSQIERAKELNTELKKELQNNISSTDVSLKIRNITEEIFVKLRICLDKTILFYLSKKNYLLDNSYLYFPISKNNSDFNSVLKNYGLGDLNYKLPPFFNLILSFQPFSSPDKEILTILQEKGSREKHQFLIKEKREANHISTTFKSTNGEVSWSKQGARFGNGVYINGVQINPITQEPVFIPSTHQLIRHYNVSVKLSDKDIEVYSLCTSLIKVVEDIVKKVIDLK